MAVRILTGTALVLLSTLFLTDVGRSQGRGTARDLFLLELPDISPTGFTSPAIPIGNVDLQTIRIRVRPPAGKRVPYGAIVLTLNGDGLNRGCAKRAQGEYIVLTCQRYEASSNIGFKLIPGKNVLEITAKDNDENEYYASFVLDRNGTATVSASAPPGSAERFTGRKFALLMGVSDYKFDDAGLTKLQYADNDAQALADFLKTPEGGGFRSADIMLLMNRDATLNALRGALAEIARRAARGDLVFIFLAGHGGPDPYAPQNMYFVFSDSKLADLPKTAYPMSELKYTLDAQIRAERVIVVVDTCHSAGIGVKKKDNAKVRQLEQSLTDNNIVNLYASKQLFKDVGRAIITSSDVNEVSREAAKWGNHGVFTWALLDGLKGKADRNGDGLITTGELFNFTRTAVQAETNSQQNPIALPGSATNLVLATVKK